MSGPIEPPVARLVWHSTEDLQRLLDDMEETMHEYDGVGLAAPQVHMNLRLAVIEVPASDERAREGVPFTVLINPRLTALGDETVPGWEGCLSIPELRGIAPRLARVRLDALDGPRQLALRADVDLLDTSAHPDDSTEAAGRGIGRGSPAFP
jgi:peptide deformylase